jgi:hypothetical protein
MWNQDYAVSSVGEYNLENSSYDPEYPTGTTNKVGHYLYFNAQGDASTCILNCSNYIGGNTAGDGGFQFHQCSATLNPQRLLKLNTTEVLVDTQFNVNKSVQGGATLVNLPAIISGQPTQVVFNYPPGLDTFGIQFGVYNNPVQVLFNAGVFVTGVTYYAQASNAQTLIIRATTNPSDTPLNCSVFTNGQVPFAFVSGTTPSSIQTAILSDNLTITTDTDISVLSSTDLTFGGTSVLSTIANLTILQKSVFNQYISAAVYADGRPPTAPTTTIAQQYAYTPSWYFKNTTAGYKINWYIGATNGMVVSDILGLYIAFFNGNNTSNDNAPFITIYTTPTGVNDYAPGFYHSSCTYVFDGSITANTRYLEFLNLHSCPIPNFYGATLRYMIQSPVAPNPRGTFLQTESVAFFSIGSNSASAVNTTEFAISKFGIMRASGTTEVNFFQN